MPLVEYKAPVLSVVDTSVHCPSGKAAVAALACPVDCDSRRDKPPMTTNAVRTTKFLFIFKLL
jgi:hypothetical protein